MRKIAKAILSVALFAIFCVAVKAQHIPDNNFANAIRKECSQCIDSKNNLLPPAKKLKSISASFDSIRNIAGIEGFSSLEDLDISYNLINVLPSLPKSIIKLDCVGNRLTVIPNLPPGLTEFKCAGNNITTLPPLPSSLKHLNLQYLKIKMLITIPPQLEDLVCSSTLVTSLPPLPESLKRLDIGNTGIMTLPKLPAGLEELDIYETKITVLPVLPAGLKKIFLNSSVFDCIPCNNSRLVVSDDDLNKPNSKTLFFCPGYPLADVATVEKKEEVIVRKPPLPLNVYFFIPEDFLEDSNPYRLEDDVAEPRISFHIKGVEGGVMVAVYLGKDEHYDPAMEDIKQTYTFTVYYHSRYDHPGEESKGNSYQVTAYPRQRRISKFIPFGTANGTYTVRLWKKYVNYPIAEGKVNFN